MINLSKKLILVVVLAFVIIVLNSCTDNIETINQLDLKEQLLTEPEDDGTIDTGDIEEE